MSPGVDLLVKTGTVAETRMRAVLARLVDSYDLEPWMFTRTILIDETAMPHSHPVLTVNTETADDEVMALAEFVHEQLHWFEEAHAERRDRAIEATRRPYPVVPVARPEGAGDEFSTRLHLIVCYLEYQAMKVLVGDARARASMVALSRHHYCWVYRTVLTDEPTLAAIVRAHDLVPAPLQSALVADTDSDQGLRRS